MINNSLDFNNDQDLKEIFISYSNIELAEKLKSVIYNSNTHGVLVNAIADRINDNLTNLEILHLAIDNDKNVTLLRSISYIISELVNEGKILCHDLIEQVFNPTDHRVIYDLSHPIFINIQNSNSKSMIDLFYNQLNINKFLANAYFSLLPQINDYAISQFIDLSSCTKHKFLYSLLSTTNTYEDSWYLNRLSSNDEFERQIVFRAAEKNINLDFNKIYSILKIVDKADLWESFSLWSKFSNELYDM